MADQFAKYADLLVGFVVLQSLSFGYALGQKSDLREAIVGGKKIILRLIIAACFVYCALIIACCSFEYLLRSAAFAPDIVRLAGVAAGFGRVLIVIAASLVAWYGLYLNKPGKQGAE